MLILLTASLALASPTLLFSKANVSANKETSPWLATEAPTLKNLRSDVAFEEVPKYVDGNQECVVQREFIARPAKKIPWQEEQSYQSCGVDTAFGTIDKSLRLTRLGTNIAGSVYLSGGTKARLSPLPNSDNALLLDFNAPSGAYITIEKDISHRLSTQKDFWTGEVKHTLGNGSSQIVKDESSNRLYGRLDERGVSGNGEWAVFDAVGIGLVRLNIDTGEVLFFAPGYRYDSGQDPLLEYAVSDDGRYIVVSSFTFSSFKIYDLDTCVKSAIANKPASCSFRDLKPLLQSNMPDYLGVGTKISFTDDYNLKFYGTTLKNGTRTRYVQLLTAAGHGSVEFPYLALGDSFASGEGAGDYKAGTDVKNPKNKCHVSVNSYPYLIGEKLGLNLFQSITCSGAKIKDIDGQGVKDYNNDKNGRQSTGKEKSIFNDTIFDNFLPGYRMQKDFVAKYHPNKITVSISGNDMGFGNIVRNCVFWDNNCYSRASERANLVKTINDRFEELVNMYGQLKQPADSDIYAIGYPKLVNPEGSCAVNVRAGHDELVFFDGLVDYINSVIKKAADSAGVYYVDVSDALDGYRLCEGGPGQVAVNGLTAGNDKLFDIGPIGNESYHPNAFGHALLEKVILEKTENFAKHNPTPLQVEPPKIEDADSFIGSAEYNYSNTRYFISDGSDAQWYKAQTKHLEQSGFAPNSNVAVTLTSDPLNIGTFHTDSGGAMNADLSLPTSVPLGYHTIHLSGQDVAGENIEYEEQVFVAFSENDYDGDGVPNSQDPCVAISPSGLDYDQDGIDDACDAQIGNPPAIPPSLADITPLPGFDPISDGSGADIINVVDSSNQNASYTAPQQGVGGLQSQTVVVPQTDTNTPLANTGGTVLFGNSTDTASLLNQSQVLGTSTEPASVNTVPATINSPSHVPYTGIIIAIILVVALALFFRRKDIKNALLEEQEETEDD